MIYFKSFTIPGLFIYTLTRHTSPKVKIRSRNMGPISYIKSISHIGPIFVLNPFLILDSFLILGTFLMRLKIYTYMHVRTAFMP